MKRQILSRRHRFGVTGQPHFLAVQGVIFPPVLKLFTDSAADNDASILRVNGHVADVEQTMEVRPQQEPIRQFEEPPSAYGTVGAASSIGRAAPRRPEMGVAARLRGAYTAPVPQ